MTATPHDDDPDGFPRTDMTHLPMTKVAGRASAIVLATLLACAGTATAQQPAPAAPAAQPRPAAPAAPAAQPRPAAPQGQGAQPGGQARPQGQGQQRPAAQAPRQPETPTQIPTPGFGELPLFGARTLEQAEIGFRLTVPAGWIADGASPEGQEGVLARLIMEGHGSPAPSCLMSVVRNQTPPRVTQAQINQALHRDQNVAGMRRTLSQGNRRIDDLRRVTRTGIAGIQARVTVPGTAMRPSITLFFVMHEALGRRFSIECQVLSADLQTQRPEIEGVFDSLEILPRRAAAQETPAETPPPARPAAAGGAQPARPAAQPARPAAQ